MFARRPRQADSFSSRYGAGKSTKQKSSFKEPSIRAGLERSLKTSPRKEETSPPVAPSVFPTPALASHADLNRNLTSPIITLVVGPDQRLFAGHEDVLCHSPFFQAACRGNFYESEARRINLPEEQPEVLSAVLEYLYKGDYYPRLLHNKRKDTWELEDSGTSSFEATATIYHQAYKQTLLKDTVIYCAADRYSLPLLSRLALRKQGLRTSVSISLILSSARYAYLHTPDTDSKLRAHYLALIIRSRRTFQRSGTMQDEMERGGTKMWFDLFVAMCNHMEDLATVRSPFRSPLTR